MEEMYEVLKFIEHDAHCRQGMDCVRGTVLLNYLKENPRIEKSVLFSWFRELAVCVDQYHRSCSRQNYRYLNPCSIIVSSEGKIYLLNMEAPDNESAMKRMQKRAVRSHFVKPVYEIGIGKNNDADLFAYGRTIQFVLAYTEVYPPLKHREERRLSGVIGRCTGEAKRKYEDLRGVLRDLPAVPKQKAYSAEDLESDNRRLSAGRRVPVIFAGTLACIAAVVLAGVGCKGVITSRDAYAREQQKELKAGEDMVEKKQEKEDQNDAAAVTRDEWRKAAEEQDILLDEAIEAYGKVMELEQDMEKMKEAGMKKMELEMRKGDYAQALETARTVAEKAEGSEELDELIGECEEETP